ncbi:MAG: glycoside hydrolase family 26 protein [Gaiellaceae bacterium]
MSLTRAVLVVLASAGAVIALLTSGASAGGKASASGRQQGFLWGAWIGTQFTGSEAPWSWRAVTEFESRNAGGRHVSALHWSVGVPWVHEFRHFTTLFNRVQTAGAVSLVDMDTGSAKLRSIANGAHSSALRTWATEAKSWGHPILLRFDWEMNGNWFPWDTMPISQNTPADFVAAWRRVHHIFSAVHASNVRWVWCPNIDPYNIWTNLASLYPGNAYVDWTCLDGYNRNAPWTSFAGLYGSSYRQIMRLAPRKPMIVGEVSSTEHGGSKAQWIQAMFGDIRTRFSHIRGLAWWDIPGPPTPHDWPIESSRSSSTAFSRGIARTLARTCRGLSGPAQTRCLGRATP